MNWRLTSVFCGLVAVWISYWLTYLPRETLPIVPKQCTIFENLELVSMMESIQMSHGRTFYVKKQVDVSDDNPLAVLVHGLTSPRFIFSPLVSELLSRNISTLQYDLYGRGCSDYPSGGCGQMSTHISQLSELFHRLSLVRKGQPVILVGYSMGAAIAARFAVTFPELIDYVVLISPTGLDVSFPFSARLVTLPFIPQVVIDAVMTTVIGEQKSLIWDKELAETFEYKLRVSMVDNPSSTKCVIETLKGFPLFHLESLYSELGSFGNELPVLVLWGKNDATTPFTGAKVMQKLIPKATVIGYEGETHNSVLNIPSEMADQILNHVKNRKK